MVPWSWIKLACQPKQRAQQAAFAQGQEERGGPRGGGDGAEVDAAVVKVDAAPGVINITFKKDAPIDPMGVIALIQKNKHIKLAGNEKLRIERELPEPKDRAQMVRDVLRSLGQPVTAG